MIPSKTTHVRTPMHDLANEMRFYAALFPWTKGMSIKPYRHALNCGLTIEFILDPAMNQWRLALVRSDGFPSTVEIGIVSVAFGVPSNTKYEYAVVGTRMIVRLKWSALIETAAV